MKRLLSLLTLCFVWIICMNSIFAMDNYSDNSESCNEEEPIDLTQYKKQELNLDNLNSDFEVDAYVKYNQKILISDNVFKNCKSKTEYHVTNVSDTCEENLNGLKRKKKQDKFKTLLCETCQRETKKYLTGKFSKQSLCQACYLYKYRHSELQSQDEQNYYGKHKDRIVVCEHCQKESNQYITGKVSGKSLCEVCYKYEYRNGCLRPQGERNYNAKHKNKILVCENCQNENKYYVTSKFSGKSVCQVCYMYEYRNGGLRLQGERNYNCKHKGKILVCENCQNDSKDYRKGKFSGKSVCQVCYNYELRYGRLRPQDEQKYNGKHKDRILVCEHCQKEGNQYITGKVSGKSLCQVCYNYEYLNYRLRPQGERYYNGKHKGKILVCENCQKESNSYLRGKLSGKSLCRVCYNYEYRNGRLRPQDEQKYNGKHKDRRNDSSNRLFEAENYQNTDRNDSTHHLTEEQNKHE